MFAAKKGAIGVAKLLIEAKVDLNARNKSVAGEHTALMYAVKNKADVGVAKLLINAGADLEAKNEVRSLQQLQPVSPQSQPHHLTATSAITARIVWVDGAFGCCTLQRL